MVPIPGTTKLHRLEENIGALSIQLTPEDLRDIDASTSKIKVEGARYPGTPGEDDRPVSSTESVTSGHEV